MREYGHLDSESELTVPQSIPSISMQRTDEVRNGKTKISEKALVGDDSKRLRRLTFFTCSATDLSR